MIISIDHVYGGRCMKKINNEQGFSLVELMVVVGIIGILSAVAVPNFKKYQAKSKTSEAKLALASIYAAEQSFQADADSYASCLADMGYEPSSPGTIAGRTQRYYTVGANTGLFGSGGLLNNMACVSASADNQSYWLGTKGRGGLGTGRLNTNLTAAPVNATSTATTFTMGAVGAVTNSGTLIDAWTINQDKLLRHVRTGY